MRISQAAVDLIISAEVSSRKYYEKRLSHFDWPGGRSGITEGIGYDLGYQPRSEVAADWTGRVSPPMVDAMLSVVGFKGDSARLRLPLVKDQVTISWEAATGVFLEHDVPRWTANVINAIPPAAKLPPDCLGALVSLAYNRGASFNLSDDRYREMRAIKAHIMSGNLPAVAADIRSMKRLWPANTGLPGRRESEARLWERGLAAKTAPAGSSGQPDVPHTATENPAPAIPPKPAGAHEHGGAGAALIAAIAAAHQWAASNQGTIIIVGGGILCAVAIWFAIRQSRKPPMVANQKDRPA